MERNTKIIIAVILFISVISIIYNMRTDEPGADASPVSATGMSVDEREEMDSSVLLEELESYGIVKTVEVSYENDGIIVRLSVPSTEQYIEKTAEEIAGFVKRSLKSRRGDMTLEKDSYFIYVYGSNGRSIAIEYQ